MVFSGATVRVGGGVRPELSARPKLRGVHKRERVAALLKHLLSQGGVTAAPAFGDVLDATSARRFRALPHQAADATPAHDQPSNALKPPRKAMRLR